MRLLLLAYATIVILLGWWPWHILLLALIAARPSNAPPKVIVHSPLALGENRERVGPET
jgi:hypothetical protein